MDSFWPWAAVAAAGALHGANPLSGWPLAALATRLWPAIGALLAGQLASLAVVAAAVPLALQFGRGFDPRLPQALAAVVLLLVTAHHLRLCSVHRVRTSCLGLGLWSFITSITHGAVWLLVPTLVPLCLSDMPGREIVAGGSLRLGLAAIGVHLAAMLVATGVVVVCSRRGFRLLRRGWLRLEERCPGVT